MKLDPYTGNWAKIRGWVLFRGWAFFHETTVTRDSKSLEDTSGEVSVFASCSTQFGFGEDSTLLNLEDHHFNKVLVISNPIDCVRTVLLASFKPFHLLPIVSVSATFLHLTLS